MVILKFQSTPRTYFLLNLKLALLFNITLAHTYTEWHIVGLMAMMGSNVGPQTVKRGWWVNLGIFIICQTASSNVNAQQGAGKPSSSWTFGRTFRVYYGLGRTDGDVKSSSSSGSGQKLIPQRDLHSCVRRSVVIQWWLIPVVRSGSQSRVKCAAAGAMWFRSVRV